MKNKVGKIACGKIEDKYDVTSISFRPDYNFIGIKIKFCIDMWNYLSSTAENFEKPSLTGASPLVSLNLVEINLTLLKVDKHRK